MHEFIDPEGQLLFLQMEIELVNVNQYISVSLNVYEFPEFCTILPIIQSLFTGQLNSTIHGINVYPMDNSPGFSSTH